METARKHCVGGEYTPWDPSSTQGTMYTHVHSQGMPVYFFGDGRKPESTVELHADMENIQHL